MILIENKNASDNMRGEKIWKSLEKLRIATDLTRKVKNTHEKT
jgi:hypothetical protein